MVELPNFNPPYNLKSHPIDSSAFLNSDSSSTREKEVDIRALSDERIWEKFRSGDEEIFIYIYNEYANLLFKYGSQFTDDSPLVKDCLQDFFIYLREKRGTLGAVTSIKFYLLKAFRRRIIEYLKRNAKNRDKINSSLQNWFPIELSHEVKFINHQTTLGQLETLQKGLSELNEREREAIYIYYFQDLSYEQVADFFNFTHVSSARRLVYRALDKLKERFGFMLFALLMYLQ